MAEKPGGGKFSGASSRKIVAERFAPRAIALVPWLDATLLVVATFLFANATARVPALRIDLPEQTFEEGARQGSLAISVLPAPAERGAGRPGSGLPAAMAFLGEERYDLASERRVEDFRRDLAAEAAKRNESKAVVYMDGALPYRDVHRVARVLRDCGLSEADFAYRASDGNGR